MRSVLTASHAARTCSSAWLDVSIRWSADAARAPARARARGLAGWVRRPGVRASVRPPLSRPSFSVRPDAPGSGSWLLVAGWLFGRLPPALRRPTQTQAAVRQVLSRAKSPRGNQTGLTTRYQPPRRSSGARDYDYFFYSMASRSQTGWLFCSQ